MKIFFGTDGWRALEGSQINESSVATIAQAFGDYLHHKKENPVVAIGYDSRKNSDTFAKVFARVLTGNGIKVLLSDRIIPTPVLSFTVLNMHCDAGVMITASHNPKEYNGIKFKSNYGGPFSTEETKKVEALLYHSPVVASPDLIDKQDFTEAYIRHIEQLIDFDKIKATHLHLLIDSMGGAGQRLTEQILARHNIPATTIFAEPATDFYGRSPEPIEKNLTPLTQALKAGNYAFGVATDGDADRVGVCLDTSEWLSAQHTILLLVDYLKRVKQTPGGIVKTSSVSDKIRLLFANDATPVYEVQVGFKYICDIMIQHEIAFGGEESGGFGYGMHIPERDGVFSSLLLLEMLAVSGYSKLSEYFKMRQSDLGLVHYDRIDLKYDRPDKNDLLPHLSQHTPESIGEWPIVDVQRFLSSRGIVNGLKFLLGPCRWLLMRSSETENIVRFYAEGQSDEEVKRLLSCGREILGI
ncbi:phosphoglucomutase [Barnesiella viscericola]|uniref:Phosphoglucomutase n=1 Tax=Barnesiella viscericola TaxID=397865 RepID=A0A921SUC2_9BACT|nr:phosphoglucomutase [Barnesiella viscericola]HJG88177.1 phosphoglucomutase [Barnesiella viscericola]